MTLVQKRLWLSNQATINKTGADDCKCSSCSMAAAIMKEEEEEEEEEEKELEARRRLCRRVALYCVDQVRYLPGLHRRYGDRLDEAQMGVTSALDNVG